MGEPLEGPAQSPVKSTKDILISSYGSDPNFISYVLSTIFNPDIYTQIFAKNILQCWLIYLPFTKMQNLSLKQLQVTGSSRWSVCTHLCSLIFVFFQILTRTCWLWRKILWMPRPIFCHIPTYSLIIKYSASKNLTYFKAADIFKHFLI